MLILGLAIPPPLLGGSSSLLCLFGSVASLVCPVFLHSVPLFPSYFPYSSLLSAFGYCHSPPAVSPLLFCPSSLCLLPNAEGHTAALRRCPPSSCPCAAAALRLLASLLPSPLIRCFRCWWLSSLLSPRVAATPFAPPAPPPPPGPPPAPVLKSLQYTQIYKYMNCRRQKNSTAVNNDRPSLALSL